MRCQQDVIDQIDLSSSATKWPNSTSGCGRTPARPIRFDLATTTIVRSNIYDSRGGMMLMPFTVTVTGSQYGAPVIDHRTGQQPAGCLLVDR